MSRIDEITCEIFGSIATGFAIEGSDLDIAIRGLNITTEAQFFDAMESLKNSLIKQQFISYCQDIPKAKVPIIKLVLILY